MMWYDGNRKKSVQEKAKRAAKYYQKKYGQKANVCHVHPDMLRGEDVVSVNGLVLVGDLSIIPNNYWVGLVEVEDEFD